VGEPEGERSAPAGRTTRGRTPGAGRYGRDRAPSLRVGVAAVAARAAATASRTLRRGGGTALPGLIAERLAPNLLAHLAAQLPGGVAVVTGTNGKTTTSHMLAAILSRAGRHPVRNASGSNLSRGIAGALAARADWTGRLATPNGETGPLDQATGLFETDEAAFARVVPALRPDVVVVTNLFRDQLDRYGEVDSVAAIWRDALAARGAGVTLALNADDPTVAALGGGALYFGVEDARLGHPGPEHAADAKVCPTCGARLEYPVCFYGHLGHYRCPNGHARPAPHVRATRLEPRGFDGTDLTLATPAGEVAFRLPLPGLYNAYNALAAAAGALALNVPLGAVRDGLAGFTAAFGRLERLAVDRRTVYLLLAKNPVGLNEALRTLFADGLPKHLLMALNDLDADGRDVSWIWDADVEHVAGRTRSLTVAGRRAEDLAVRLKYAEVSGLRSQVSGLKSGEAPPAGQTSGGAPAGGLHVIEPDLGRALDLALAAVPPGETLYCVLTYTALLALRQVLVERGHLAPYWQDEPARGMT
jgi:UDP-N-acetylmuramyl tripeptide synthase